MNKESKNSTQLLIQSFCKEVDNLEKRLDQKDEKIKQLKIELLEIKRRVIYQER